MAPIPEKLVNFKCYGGTGQAEILGMTDVELPSFEAMTETIMGAGIAGEYESPVIGHFKSQVVKLKWRTITAVGLRLLAPTLHRLDLRGSAQLLDPAINALVTQSLVVEVNGEVKTFGLGKFEPGKPMEASSDIEVSKITVKVAGVTVIEFDKFNMIFKVAGFDHLRQVRVDMGGV